MFQTSEYDDTPAISAKIAPMGNYCNSFYKFLHIFGSMKQMGENT